MQKAIISLLVLLVAATSTRAAPPATAPVKTQFLRFVQRDNGAAELQAAIVQYADANGRRVDLVSAIHIGDAAYFRTLNRIFMGYEAVLYEMVKPREAPAPRPGEQGGRHAIGAMQRGMTTMLDLAFQLDIIDYTRPNFVHADLDWETFEQRQDDRGESFFSIFMNAMMREMTRPQKGRKNPELQMAELLFALQSKDRPRQLKLVLAKQFEDIDAQVALIEGPKGSVILTERNEAALQVLDEQLKLGKKKLAIFYGAAHLRGMEKALKKRGFQPAETQWVTAWNIPPAPVTQPATRPAMN